MNTQPELRAFAAGAVFGIFMFVSVVSAVCWAAGFQMVRVGTPITPWYGSEQGRTCYQREGEKFYTCELTYPERP